MKIFKFILMSVPGQIVRMPAKSEIMDVQIQSGVPVMWALVDDSSEIIDVKINMYWTGEELRKSNSEEIYLATVQDGEIVCHFFMEVEK